MPAKQVLPGRRPSAVKAAKSVSGAKSARTVKAQGRRRPAGSVRPPGGRGPLERLRRTQRQLRKAWDRPLTAYYL
ncbi:hypothetical protein ACWDA9_20515, partial [Streptomyces sp. NPDC001193]